MAKTKSQEGACSTPVKGQINHLSKNQSVPQQCDVECPVFSVKPIKKGNVSKPGRRSRSSSPRQQDLSSRQRTGIPQETASLAENSLKNLTTHQETDKKSCHKYRSKKRLGIFDSGIFVESDVPKTCSAQNDHTSFPQSASSNLNSGNATGRRPVEEEIQAEGQIFVYQNVKHAISGLPGGTKTSEGTSTPIVCIRDVLLQGYNEAKVARGGTLCGIKLKKHLLKTSSNSNMANEEPSHTGNKKKISPKKGSNQSPTKLENQDLAEKPSKTKAVIKHHSEKKENLKNSSMLLKESPTQPASNGTKSSPSPEKIEKVKKIKKKRSPSSTVSAEMKSMSDAITTDSRVPNDSGPEITLNNGDQLSLDTVSADTFGYLPLSTSSTPPKDGDLRHGRRLRSPSVRYADDMILFPLKSPRRSPKFGVSQNGSSPEDRQDKTPEHEKPIRLPEGEKLTKTAECQTSELYALLTRTLSNDKIITPSRRKSQMDTASESDKYPRAKKQTGAVREIDFSEGVKTNTRDSQIQVQMEEHLANVHKEELNRLRNEFSTDTTTTSSPSTSGVSSYHTNTKSDSNSRQCTDTSINLKQKSPNKNVSKHSNSKASDSKQKGSSKKEPKQAKATDSKQKCVLKSDKTNISKAAMDSHNDGSEMMDLKQYETNSEHLSKSNCEKTDSEKIHSKHSGGKQKGSKKSVQKQSFQSETGQSHSKQNSPKSKSCNKTDSQEVISEKVCSVKKPKKTGGKSDSKHKVKTKNTSKQMEVDTSPVKQVKVKMKEQSNKDIEQTSKSKSELKQKGDSEKLQCDKSKPDPSCVSEIKTESDSQRSASSDKDVSNKVSLQEDKHKSDIPEVSDIKQDPDKPTNHSEASDAMETSNKSDSAENSVTQKPKSSNLFSLISRVKLNLECPKTLPEFLNSPLYEPVPGVDEEASDESLTALDNDGKMLLDDTVDKDKISLNDKPSTEIPDNETKKETDSESGKDTVSTALKGSSPEKHPQMRKDDQNKNSLEDLLSPGGQDEVPKSHESERVTRRSPNKTHSPGRITRAQTSPEKHQSHGRMSRRYNSPDKNTIYPADVILVDSATSSSDNVKPATTSEQKEEEKVDQPSSTVTSTDADSTTDDSPARKNIFDLLMCSYKPGEKEDEEEDGKEEENTVKDTNDIDKLPANTSVDCDHTDSKKESEKDTSEKDLQSSDSSKKESKVPDPIVDLTCDDDDDLEPDEAQKDKKRLSSSQIGLTGIAALKSNLGRSSTVSNVSRVNTGHDTLERPKITEPKPLEVLKSLEMDNTDKMAAFQSKSLDEYLRKMKKQKVRVGSDDDDDDEADEEEEEDEEENDEDEEENDEDDGEDVDEEDEENEESEQKEFEEELEPDFDEVDDMVFVSFPSEETLSAHIEVERKTRIGKNENLLLGISRLRNLRKKRDQMQMKYNKRIYKLKALKAQAQMNQNLRGMHKALEKYQKMYRTELYMILKSKNKNINFKSPQKTSDITKIKGWKKKFGNTEQLAEATGLPISQAGKLHWRTEARLLKKLKPDELKEIGLNLKKKRRKNLIFTIRKGMSKGDNKSERNEDGVEENEDLEQGDDEEDHEHELGDDDFNKGDSWFEDFDISSEKEKKSQYIKKQERLKKRLMLQSLNFGPEEETIIRKLGGQRSLRKSILGINPDDKIASLDETVKGKRGRKKRSEAVYLTTVSQSMALNALEALDKRFVQEKPKPAPVPKTASPVKTELSDRLGLKEEVEDIDDEWLPAQKSTKEKKIFGKKKKKKFPQKSKKENEVQCDQPGCRYGCICHLCKFADPVPDSDNRSSQDAPCDKEYCRLGCICDSIGARGRDPAGGCQKPECQNGCQCVKDEQVEGTEEEKQQKQKGVQKKFEALPRRQSTYRLAKNLDAVSRKAMLYYESSEMYCTEQTTRKRKSKETDDLTAGQNKTVCHLTGPGPTSVTTADPTYTAPTIVPTTTTGSGVSAMQVVPPPTQAMENRMNRFVISAGQIKSSYDTGLPDEARKPVSKPSKQTRRNDLPWHSSHSAKSRKKEEASVRRTEFDDITFDEMLESDNEDSPGDTCARTAIYTALRRSKQRCTCHAEAGTPGYTTPCQKAASTESASQQFKWASTDSRRFKGLTSDSGSRQSKAVESGDSVSPIVISPGNTPPASPMVSASARLSYGAKNVPSTAARKTIHTGWHTQWVCLKTSTRMPQDEGVSSYEIRLLEMISNCNWENAKQKILSKISSQINREHYPKPRQMVVGEFCISFLPRSDKPAIIPPEVKAKLPKSIFSIRIKVERQSQLLKSRLGDFISAQEKILKPSLESPDVIAIDEPPTATTTVTTATAAITSATSLLTGPSGGISGLSHLQIKGHTTSSSLKRVPPTSVAGKTVTSPSHVSPQGVSSPSSALLKPGMSTKVSNAPPQGSVGKAPSSNLVILQNCGGQKYVLTSPVTQPSQLQLVSPANSSGPVISSAQILTRVTAASSFASTPTSTTNVVSSGGPVLISAVIPASGATSLPASAVPVMTNPAVRMATQNAPVAIPVNKPLPPNMSLLSPIITNVPEAISPANSGVTLIANNVPQSNPTMSGPPLSGQNVINMTFTLPGKSTSHSTVTTPSGPVTLLANSKAVTMVAVATSVSPATSVKTVLSSIPGSLLTKPSGQVLFPGMKLAPTSTASIVSKLVPIVPKVKQDEEPKPVPTSTPAVSSSRKAPAKTDGKSNMSDEEFQQMFKASKEKAKKKEINVIEDLRLGPSDNKQLVAKATKEKGNAMFQSFIMSRPPNSSKEEEAKQGKKRKNPTNDDDTNQESVEDSEEKTKKKKKKKKLKSLVEGEEGEKNSLEEGEKFAKKRKKKKEKSKKSSDGAMQSGSIGDMADGSSPPAKKCRNDSTDLETDQATVSDTTEATKVDSECDKNGSNHMETSTENGDKFEVTETSNECDIETKSDSLSDKGNCSELNSNNNCTIEAKCIKDQLTTSNSLELTETKDVVDKITETKSLEDAESASTSSQMEAMEVKSAKDTDSTCDQIKITETKSFKEADSTSASSQMESAEVESVKDTDSTSGQIMDTEWKNSEDKDITSSQISEITSASITENKSVKDADTTSTSDIKANEIKIVRYSDSTSQVSNVTTNLHSVLFSQIENSIREYDDKDDITTADHTSPTNPNDHSTNEKTDLPSTEETDIKQCNSTTVNTTNVGATDDKQDSPPVSESESSKWLPVDNGNTSDEVDGQENVSTKKNLSDSAMCAESNPSDQAIPLQVDFPPQFEMDTESSEGDRQSCETSQNSLNDLKMVATVQKASMDVLQIIEGTKNPEGAKHPLVPVIVSSEEEDITKGNVSIRSRVTKLNIDEHTDNGAVEKPVNKNTETVNKIHQSNDVSQEKTEENKQETGDLNAEDEKSSEESKEEDEAWDSRMGHEGCDDVVISLSDDEETNDREAEHLDNVGATSTSKEIRTSVDNSIPKPDAVPVIVIDDEDKPADQQVVASSDVKSNRVIPPGSQEVDVAVSENENDDSDIDIENASDEEMMASNQLMSYLMTEKQKFQPAACSIHSHKGKRKASLDTIDNMLVHSVEFREGIVKAAKQTPLSSKERTSRHNSLEKQRRRELKNGFKDLIEVIFGQDEFGQKKVLCVEAIQGASKIKVLHMALTMIQKSEERSVESLGQIESLKHRNMALKIRLNKAKSDLMNAGMPAMKIQDILTKISNTCQFIFAKREMLMKKKLDTQKAAQEYSAPAIPKPEEKLEPKVMPPKPRKPNPKSNSKSKTSQAQKQKGKTTQIQTQSVPYTAVPVQLVSTAQVLHMAQVNQQSQPEIYIDNAEDRGVAIKEERLSEDEQDLPLQISNSWSQLEGGPGVGSGVNTKLVGNSNSVSGREKEDEEELERMNTQSPVFSDVDISENYFVQDDDDDNMDGGGEDQLASSHTSSEMEYKVIDTSSHSEVMVGYMPEDILPGQERMELDGGQSLGDRGQSLGDSNTPSVGVS